MKYYLIFIFIFGVVRGGENSDSYESDNIKTEALRIYIEIKNNVTSEVIAVGEVNGIIHGVKFKSDYFEYIVSENIVKLRGDVEISKDDITIRVSCKKDEKVILDFTSNLIHLPEKNQVEGGSVDMKSESLR